MIAYDKKNDKSLPAHEWIVKQHEEVVRRKEEIKAFYIKPKTKPDDIIKKHEADKETLRKKKQSQEHKLTNAKQQNRRT